MSLTVADIKNRFSEFEAIDSVVVQRWLDEAARNHNATQWGEKSDDGLAWLTAHFLTAFASTSGGGGGFGPGPLTATAEGQTSASWSPLTIPKIFAKNDLGTTPYGRRYLSLLQTLFVTRCT
jgi:hypothetical protein